MEEKSINEKESLELISRMIATSKNNLRIGQGNVLMYFGYFTATLSIVIGVLIGITRNPGWSWCWALMFVFWFFMERLKKNRPATVVTYTDRVISQVWRIIGIMFVITFIVLTVSAFSLHNYGIMNPMMPLSLVYVCLGVSIVGAVVREPYVTYIPIIGILFALAMMVSIYLNGMMYFGNIFGFGLSFIVIMAIPGHILNCKAKKSC
ncbi:MAG: hypothetical protein Q8907_06810 [Bacteroidota bacterium]|nr:hypothetical protein [Bacteroidota bacterium]